MIYAAKKQNQSEVIFIYTHPDPAYIAGFYKHQLETKHGVKITNVLVMTDHFPANPQFIWNLIDMDLIVAPDELTAKLTEKQLEYWAKIMKPRRLDRNAHLPKVVVSGFPQEPLYQQPINPNIINRQEQLDPKYEGPINIAIPLGGASPQMSFLADTILSLKKLIPQIKPWTLFKKHTKQSDEIFVEKMHQAGATVETVQDNFQLVTRLCDNFNSDTLPALLIVKPGELSNLALFDPQQKGGVILLFTQPVGDQEVQNIHFLQSESGGCVMPNDRKNQQLIQFLLKIADQSQLEISESEQLSFIRKSANNWRGLSLPKKPNDAAKFIFALRKFGILAVMSKYQKPENLDIQMHPGMSDHGSSDFFYKLNAVYEELKARVMN